MDIVYRIHALFGERFLPLLIVLAAIWLTIRWRANQSPDLVARLFPVLVDIQVTLGLIYFVYGLFNGAAGRYLSFPFLLHPIIGILAAGVAHMALRPGSRAARLGRWAPLVSLGLLALLVVVNIALGNTAGS